MFGIIPNTTSSGFSFGASTGGLSGASTGGFSFGTNPGANSGTATTGGFGGFSSLAGSGGMAPASTTQQTGGFNFGAAGTKSVTASTGGFGGFSFGTSQQAQAPQTSAVGGFTTGTVANTGGGGFTTGTVGNTGGGGFTLGTATTGSTVFGTLKSASPAALPVPASSGLAGFGPAATKGASGSLLGGLLTSTTSTSVPATTTSTAPTGGFSFGPTAATTASQGGGGFSFGATPSTAAAPVVTTASQGCFGFVSTSQPATTAPTLGSSLALGSGFNPASTSTAAVVSTPAATSLASVTGPSLPGTKQMTFRQLEETINKWTTELEEQEKYFLDQATQVNAWDRIVMENGEKIVQLNKDVEKVKLDQQKLDHELDFIHSQQKELEDILTPLEKTLDSSPAISYQQHADIEREHTYILTESLDAQLKRMGQDLKEIIERLNSSNNIPDSNDPVQQITKILNAHVVSLMWVDRNTANLQRRVEEISKKMDVDKREQERNFRLAYS